MASRSTVSRLNAWGLPRPRASSSRVFETIAPISLDCRSNGYYTTGVERSPQVVIVGTAVLHVGDGINGRDMKVGPCDGRDPAGNPAATLEERGHRRIDAMSNLADKIALVTGASKGIGASIAEHLALAGATVIVNYATSKSGADKVVGDIIAAGGKVTVIQGDFSKPDDITRVYAEIARTHKRLDILVNNAGVYAFGSIEEVTPEEFHREFNLNVLGLLLATKEAVRLIGPQGGSV